MANRRKGAGDASNTTADAVEGPSTPSSVSTRNSRPKMKGGRSLLETTPPFVCFSLKASLAIRKLASPSSFPPTPNFSLFSEAEYFEQAECHHQTSGSTVAYLTDSETITPVFSVSHLFKNDNTASVGGKPRVCNAFKMPPAKSRQSQDTLMITPLGHHRRRISRDQSGPEPIPWLFAKSPWLRAIATSRRLLMYSRGLPSGTLPKLAT